MGKHFPCFKAYDIRGKVPAELDAGLAYAIGRAYADHTGAAKVCVGYDIRLSGPELCEALCKGLNEAGVDAVRLGMVGTEMVYFATAFYGYGGGVMITASHNPTEYNGMKLVRQESRPISSDSGLDDIERRAFEKKWERSGSGSTTDQDVYDDFVAHVLGFIEPKDLKPLRVLLDAGNGAAGVALEKLLPHLPLQAEKMNFEPDGRFPNGVPNPILPESRRRVEERLRNEPGSWQLAVGSEGTDSDSQANPKSKISKSPPEGNRRSGQNPKSGIRQSSIVNRQSFAFAVAWDGDYDRCFFLDGDGNFIEGYYIVGLLAQSFLTADQPSPTHPATPYLNPKLVPSAVEGSQIENPKSSFTSLNPKLVPSAAEGSKIQNPKSSFTSLNPKAKISKSPPEGNRRSGQNPKSETDLRPSPAPTESGTFDHSLAIVYDPRLTWNTLDIVAKYGGRAVVCKSGHAFIKEKMREVNAVYGGEMSAHHYFRGHWYCDSGMVPFLLVAQLVSRSGRSLGDLVGEMIANYPCSGEINATVADPVATMAKLEEIYKDGKIDRLDGLSVEYPSWRFNLRPSNTEPVIRLNVESRGDRSLMEQKTRELMALIAT